MSLVRDHIRCSNGKSASVQLVYGHFRYSVVCINGGGVMDSVFAEAITSGKHVRVMFTPVNPTFI